MTTTKKTGARCLSYDFGFELMYISWIVGVLRIVYDDRAIDALLDRSQEAQEEKAIAMNDYLESFKVATYQVKEGEEVRNTLSIIIKMIS